MSSQNGNGHHVNAQSRPIKAGVWAPIPSFMNDKEELDLATFSQHVVRLAKAGMAPVVCGSMGEAHHLLPEERVTLFKTARKALDDAGLKDTVLIAGTGANTTRGTIQLCEKAAEAGADIAIVIAPGYFSGAMTRLALKTFFLDVQSASPIPVMIYNFPGASGGIDLDSDLVDEITRAGDNICGIKLTCGAVGKLTRITASTHARQPTFLTLGGFADFLAPAIVGGRGHGAIMGLGNIYPYSLARLFALSNAAITDSTALPKALQLQDLVSEADASFTRAGIAGTKWYLQTHRGYPSRRMRRPLLDFDDERGKALEKEDGVVNLMAIEKALEKEALS